MFQLGALWGQTVLWELVCLIRRRLPQLSQHGLPSWLHHPFCQGRADGEKTLIAERNALDYFFCLALNLCLSPCRCSQFPPSLCLVWSVLRAGRSPQTQRSTAWWKRASTTTSSLLESTAAGKCFSQSVCARGGGVCICAGLFALTHVIEPVLFMSVGPLTLFMTLNTQTLEKCYILQHTEHL